MKYQAKQLLFLLLWLSFCMGMTLSPALISISLGLIALLGIPGFSALGLSKTERTISLAAVLFYLSGALSYFYSDNSDEALRKILLKLPILLVPFIIQSFKKQAEIKTQLLIIFCYSVYLPGIVSVYNYLSNKTLFDQLILESKPLPVEFGYGIYHIQFSILLAIAIVAGTYYCINQYSNRRNINYFSIASLTILNFFIIHILSARTGLLGCYAGLIIIAISKLRNVGRKTFWISVSAAMILPLIVFSLSSSLQNRIKNSVEDLRVVLNQANPNDYSFAMRVEAWKNAVDVIKQAPLSGVGIGDAEKTLHDNFEHFNPSIEKDNRKNPHFQLLESAVQSGIPALILLLFLFMYGISVNLRNAPLAAAFFMLLLLSSCFESILERQASVAAFAVFIGWGLAFQTFKEPVKDAQ
ncbi:MAG: O-antigen ligase family protein [Chitinophagaceae bacterium]